MQILVSTNAENFIPWKSLSVEKKDGTQMFGIDSIPQCYSFIKLVISQTFGENRTYCNQFLLLKESFDDISCNKDNVSSMDLSNINQSDTQRINVSSRLFEKEGYRTKTKSEVPKQVFDEIDLQKKHIRNKPDSMGGLKDHGFNTFKLINNQVDSIANEFIRLSDEIRKSVDLKKDDINKSKQKIDRDSYQRFSSLNPKESKSIDKNSLKNTIKNNKNISENTTYNYTQRFDIQTSNMLDNKNKTTIGYLHKEIEKLKIENNFQKDEFVTIKKLYKKKDLKINQLYEIIVTMKEKFNDLVKTEVINQGQIQLDDINTMLESKLQIFDKKMDEKQNHTYRKLKHSMNSLQENLAENKTRSRSRKENCISDENYMGLNTMYSYNDLHTNNNNINTIKKVDLKKTTKLLDKRDYMKSKLSNCSTQSQINSILGSYNSNTYESYKKTAEKDLMLLTTKLQGKLYLRDQKIQELKGEMLNNYAEPDIVYN